MAIGFLFEKNDKTAKIRVDGRTVEVPLSELPEGAEELGDVDMGGAGSPSNGVGNPPNSARGERIGIPGTGTPSAPSNAPTAPKSNAGHRQQYAMQKLVSLGWSPVQAAGVVGRFMQEAYADLRTGAIGDAGISLGIGQWNKERRQALVSFAKDRKTSPYDFDTQLEFFDHEIRNSPSEKLAFRSLSTAETPEQAAAAMMHYERPRGYSVKNPSAGHGYSNSLRNTASVLQTYDPNAQIALASNPGNGDPSLFQTIDPAETGTEDDPSGSTGNRFVPPDLSVMTPDTSEDDQRSAVARQRIAAMLALGQTPSILPTESTFGDFFRGGNS
ncbi:phage tail tip lysozyme [Rhizobium sp. BK251]|uniref:phage tail tip lysozyme n=1 Tax=Rhizobium sp. BK251 TaxID=2512125 RepID=UPI001046FBF3|nr:phage tail tip lysozyme [Rhizobium sp. BK251]TCL70461.1 hypothetical protein EV286_107335 [Rhizobium sp. BK251]